MCLVRACVCVCVWCVCCVYECVHACVVDASSVGPCVVPTLTFSTAVRSGKVPETPLVSRPPVGVYVPAPLCSPFIFSTPKG